MDGLDSEGQVTGPILCKASLNLVILKRLGGPLTPLTGEGECGGTCKGHTTGQAHGTRRLPTGEDKISKKDSTS